MSSLYGIRVQEIPNDTTVNLQVQVIHPDAMHISASPGFALMLLCDPAGDADPLAQEVDFENTLDGAWMRSYARGFVRQIKLVELVNEPPPNVQGDPEHEYWNTPSGWLRGTLRIEVSDPAWIAHLSEGLSWRSAAFEPSAAYDDCDPIYPEADDPGQAAPAGEGDEHAGLIPIPRIFFLNLLGSFDDEFIWFPKYSDKAYVADEFYEGDGITEEVLDSLVGKVVEYSSHGEGLGVLGPDYSVISISIGSWGAMGKVKPGQGKVGQARFNTKKKRLGEPLSISKLARYVEPAVVEASVDGTRATLKVCCFDRQRELALNHEAEALALLAEMEYESFYVFSNATSKLGKLLHETAQQDDLRFQDRIFAKVAGGIVTDFTVEKTSDGEAVDFDALSDDELIAAFQKNPWATWTVKISVTDPAWIEHLPTMVPFSYGFYSKSEPQPWEAGPLTEADQ